MKCKNCNFEISDTKQSILLVCPNCFNRISVQDLVEHSKSIESSVSPGNQKLSKPLRRLKRRNSSIRSTNAKVSSTKKAGLIRRPKA